MKFKTKKTEWDSSHYNTAAPDSSDILRKNQGRYYRGTVTRTFSAEDPNGAELLMITVTLKSAREENNLSKNLDLTSENALEDSPNHLALSLSEVTVTPLSNEEELPSVGDEVLVMVIDNIDSSLYNTDGYYIKTIEPISLYSKLSEYAKGYLEWAKPSNVNYSGASTYPSPPPALPTGKIIPKTVEIEDNVPIFPDTKDKSEQQKYDFYAEKVISAGYQVENRVNKAHIVAIRKKTNFYANNGNGMYDDRFCVIWLDSSGNKRAREFVGNTEPSAMTHGWGNYQRWKAGEDPRNLKSKYIGGIVYEGDQLRYSPHTRKSGAKALVGTYPIQKTKKGHMQGPRYYRYVGDPKQNQKRWPPDGMKWTKPGGHRSTDFLFHTGGNGSVWSAGCQTQPKGSWVQFWQLISTFGYKKWEVDGMKYNIIHE